ncbi:MAG: glycosyltransferase family 4 protein [Anaerohalosphaera sp.]|nr:glycosyltransferase family 4 protein [Anaerohalosphaera sp.]
MSKHNKQKRICLLSSVPGTLRGFYRDLIVQLRKDGFDITLITSDGPELYQMESTCNCSVFSVDITRRMSPFRDFISICRLWLYMLTHRFDIIHAHTPKGGLIGMTSSFLARIPNRVYTIHGLPLETACGLKRRLLWLAEKVSCAMATKILAVSPSLMQRVIDERLCKPGKIEVLSKGSACGIDLDRFSLSDELVEKGKVIRDKYSIADDAIVVGYAGRMVPDKGIETLVGAFELLASENPLLHLLLVGDLETVRESLDESILERIEDNKRIHFHNEFTNEVQLFYAAMDIMTLPSRREGFGLTLMEAAAMGLPTVATKVTGCVDAVVDGQTGLLVEPDSAEQLAGAISKLAENPELRDELGRNGCIRAEKDFGSKHLISIHSNLYNDLINKTL